jgi:RND family efflux transporter MFP subunit
MSSSARPWNGLSLLVSTEEANMSVRLVLVIAGAALAGCGRGSSPPQSEAGSAPPGGSVTLWTDSTELFMEYPGLVVGQPAKFNVHLTDLTDFAPLRSGKVSFRFDPEGGGEGFTVVQEAPRAPGIYGPSPEFPRPGVWNLTITVESPQVRDVIPVPGLPAYATAAEIPPESGGNGGGVAFLKEQQWKTDGFRSAFVQQDSVMESFEVTGRVVPAGGRFAQVAAPIAGLVDAAGAGRWPIPGQRVARGQVLVTLIPSLGEAGSAYAEARGALRQAEEEYARAKRLFAVEAVPERRVHEAEIRLQVAREALAGLSGGGTLTADGRLPIRAPISGEVTARLVVPGARVAPGEALFSIVDPSVVWLAVNVPAARLDDVRRGSGAFFRLEGSEQTHEARRMISRGSVVDSMTRTIPVVYETANPRGAIAIGANARVAIRSGRWVTGLVIPASAVLDQDGRPIAYVQVEGELFEKRELRLGGREGDRVLVLGGIASGDRVVTGAAYQVRLASLSTSVPAEGHEH